MRSDLETNVAEAIEAVRNAGFPKQFVETAEALHAACGHLSVFLYKHLEVLPTDNSILTDIELLHRAREALLGVDKFAVEFSKRASIRVWADMCAQRSRIILARLETHAAGVPVA